MNYYQFTVHTVTEAVEALSEAFLNLGCGGVEIFDPKDILNQEKDPTAWDYIDEDLLKDLRRDEVLMKCYFSEEVITNLQDLENKIFEIQECLRGISEFLPTGSGRIETSIVAEEDWMNAWKAYYQPFHLGHHIFVVPSWIEAENEPQDIRITMDPGMAFGTGTHETTSMCMALLEDIVKPEDVVFDIGCGSGILGIVAAKVGAKEVICSDLDPSAVAVAKENVAKNDVADIITVCEGDLVKIDALQGRKANVIVANIIADVIIYMAPSLPPYLAENGSFIASGIIKERKEDVVRAIEESGFEVVEIVEKGSWVAVVSKVKTNA